MALLTNEKKVPELAITLKLNNKEITSGERISFQPGKRELSLVYKSLNNVSMNYAEVRVTKDGDAYDIGIGNLAAKDFGAISANEYHTLSFNVIPETFNKGDGVYRISLYVKSAIDGSWNVYHIFLTVDDLIFVPKDADGLDVVTDQDIPEDGR